MYTNRQPGSHRATHPPCHPRRASPGPRLDRHAGRHEQIYDLLLLLLIYESRARAGRRLSGRESSLTGRHDPDPVVPRASLSFLAKQPGGVGCKLHTRAPSTPYATVVQGCGGRRRGEHPPHHHAFESSDTPKGALRLASAAARVEEQEVKTRLENMLERSRPLTHVRSERVRRPRERRRGLRPRALVGGRGAWTLIVGRCA